MVKYFAHDAVKILNQFTNPFVIMLDGYEALVNILRDGDEKSFLADAWLHKEDGLAYLLPNVFWVIAGREQLRWDEELLPENHKHLMGQISFMDAKSYFHQIGIWDNDLIEGLYQLTGGTPVYMDWCYKKYLQLIEKGRPDYHLTVDDFGKNTADLAERYLRDMSPTHQDVIRIMCCLPDMWDDELYTWVAKEAGYLECLGEICNKVKELSLIEKQNNFYKVHETFRTVVLDFITKEKKEQISENVFKYLFAILDGEKVVVEKPVVIKHFVQSLSRIGQYITWNDEKLEKLIECTKAFENDIRYQEQLETANAIFTFVKEITGDERNLNYLYAMFWVAKAYENVGQYNKALELAEQAYKMAKSELGDKHSFTQNILAYLEVEK